MERTTEEENQERRGRIFCIDPGGPVFPNRAVVKQQDDNNNKMSTMTRTRCQQQRQERHCESNLGINISVANTLVALTNSSNKL